MSPRRCAGGSPLSVALSGEKGRNCAWLSLQELALGMAGPGRERARSRSPLRGRDGRSCFGDSRDSDHSAGRRRGPASRGPAARDGETAGACKRSLQCARGPGAAQEQSLLRHREMSRSGQGGSELCSRSVQHTDCEPSARKRRRLSSTSPRCDQSRVDSAVPGPSSSCLKQAPMLGAAQEQIQVLCREQRRSPERGCDLQGRFVQCTEQLPCLSKRKRRRTSCLWCDGAPGDKAALGLSTSSFRQAAVLRAAQEQA